jgi:hypothetical protein
VRFFRQREGYLCQFQPGVCIVAAFRDAENFNLNSISSTCFEEFPSISTEFTPPDTLRHNADTDNALSGSFSAQQPCMASEPTLSIRIDFRGYF